jgi:hypothetical protein
MLKKPILTPSLVFAYWIRGSMWQFYRPTARAAVTLTPGRLRRASVAVSDHKRENGLNMRPF